MNSTTYWHPSPVVTHHDSASRLLPNDLPSLVSGKITQPVIDYLVNAVLDTVQFAVSATSQGPAHAKVHPRRQTSDRKALTAFVSYVVQRSGCTLSSVIGALVYIRRAKSKLLVTDSHFANHRIFLGALIVASKYLNDASLKNTHWSTCSRFFSTHDVHRIEREFLSILAWQLAVIEEDLVCECEHMVQAGVLKLPARETKKSVSLQEVREIWAEVGRERLERRKRTKSAMEMEVDGGEEERRRGRKERRFVEDYSSNHTLHPLSRIRTPPPGYDSESPTSASSSGSSSSRSSPDSAISISPQTPPQSHSNVFQYLYLPTSESLFKTPPPGQPKLAYNYDIGRHRSSSSVSSTSSGYQPLQLLESFPAVPKNSAVSSRPRTAALPNAPPPLPTLPPLSPYDVPITFSTVHIPAPANAVTASSTQTRERPEVPKIFFQPPEYIHQAVLRDLNAYKHKRGTATDLYPSYLPSMPPPSAIHV